jgi:hypothetical protein
MHRGSTPSRLAVILCLLLAGCLGEQTIHGAATIKGQATSGGIGVCGACPRNGGGRTCYCAFTAPDGSYVLHQDQDGPNWITANAVSTLGGSITVEVDGSGDVEAPAMVFTPLGGVEGQIDGATGTGLPGVVVGVDGTSNVAITGAEGHYALDGVLSGEQTLTADFAGRELSLSVLVPYDARATATTIIAP